MEQYGLQKFGKGQKKAHLNNYILNEGELFHALIFKVFQSVIMAPIPNIHVSEKWTGLLKFVIVTLATYTWYYFQSFQERFLDMYNYMSKQTLHTTLTVRNDINLRRNMASRIW